MRAIITCYLISAIIATITLTSTAYAQQQQQNNQFLDHAILVNVNDKKITRSQLDAIGMLLFKMHFPNRDEKSINEAELEELSANALKELIIMCLTEDEMQILNDDDDDLNDIEITSEDIDRQIKNLNIKDLSITPIIERYAKSRVIKNKIIYGSKSGMDPSPRDIKTFYLKNRKTVFTEQRMVRIRELFLSSDSSNADIAKKQAYMLYNTLKKSSTRKRLTLFPQMAKEFSQDMFKKNGGLIPTGTPGNFMAQDSEFKRQDGRLVFPQPMIDAIYELNSQGDIMITKSDRGWHILLLDAIKGGRKIPISKCRAIIENFLADENFEDAYHDWLITKVKKSRIAWNDGTEFPLNKIVARPKREEQLRYLRAQLQYYINMKKKRR